METKPITDDEVKGITPPDGKEWPRYTGVLNLAEAETLRWVARTRAHPVTAQCGFILRLVTGLELDHSLGYVARSKTADDVEARKCDLALIKFFNCEMFFDDDDLKRLEDVLDDSSFATRQRWFMEAVRLRGRLRYVWADTPVARLFSPSHASASHRRTQASLEGLRVALREKGTIDRLEALLNECENDKWTHDELRTAMLRLAPRIGVAPGDLYDCVRAVEADSAGRIAKSDLNEAFQISAAITHIKNAEERRMARLAVQEAERMEKADQMWQCSNCTFLNSALSSVCAMCDFGWTGMRECPPDKWECTANTGGCTFFNPKAMYYCQVCQRARPDLKTMTFF